MVASVCVGGRGKEGAYSPLPHLFSWSFVGVLSQQYWLDITYYLHHVDSKGTVNGVKSEV